MGRFFNAEILKSQPIHFRYLTDEELIKHIKSQVDFDDLLIYFLCKVKKLRFDLTDIGIDGNELELTIVVGGKNRVRTKFPFADKEFSIDFSESTEKELVIDIKDSPDKIYLIPETVGQRLKLNFGNRPEIVYIGESLSIIGRLQKHEKIVETTSKLNDDEELRIYINSFKYSYIGGIEDNIVFAIGNLGLNLKNLDKAEMKDIMRLTERVLIHFFQPEFNSDHKGLDITTDPLTKEILLQHKVTGLYISYDIDTEFYDFYTPSQALSNKTFYFNFNKPDNGYNGGEPPFDEIQ